MANASVLTQGIGARSANEPDTVVGLPPPSSVPAALVVLSGMAAGAVTGALAGPGGMIAGAVIGSAIGAASSIALDADQVERDIKDEGLDRDIGVIDGHIGEASPDQPASVRGTFSAASMGLAHESQVPPSDGPIQNVDED
jgi:hypothetical protein